MSLNFCGCWLLSCLTMKENGAHFFEGTEKLLEVWFARQQPAQQEPHQSKGSGDLRTIPRSVNGRGLGGGGKEEAVGSAALNGREGGRGRRMAGARRARVWRRRRCVCERSGGGGGVVVAVRGLAAALRGGWVPGEPLVATAARARGGGLGPCASCRPPSFPTPPPPPLPSVTAPASSPVCRRNAAAAGGQGVTFRCPPETTPPPPTPRSRQGRGAGPRRSLPSSWRRGREVAGPRGRRGSPVPLPPPRAAPCGPCWQHVVVAAAGRGEAGCGELPGEAGWRSVAVLLAAGGARQRRPPLCS